MPLFQSDEILSLTLEADFKSVFAVKDDSTYFPVVLLYTDAANNKREFVMEVRTRGKTRREICKTPPLRLRFPKDITEKSAFDGQRAIKLVTHCKQPNVYEQNTILEYLIYRAFNLLTDSSFKVRPAIISYVYTGKKKKTVDKFAFFVERDKHVAERIQGVEIETVKIHPNRLNVFHTSLMDMFQYMIGNTDYSAFEYHNVKLMGDKTGRLPAIAIPYDFDWCGLVKASYAEPNSKLNIENVTDRLYRGFKKSPEVVNRTIKIFNQNKVGIYQLFNDFKMLSKGEKKRVIKYLDEFYWIINDKSLVKTEFIDKARILHN
ncbi:MAG: hypothetical protein GY834_06865 [Bacteroidetes bacterium]|nr:hypothetical protein [Bacteroidota bacterium]